MPLRLKTASGVIALTSWTDIIHDDEQYLLSHLREAQSNGYRGRLRTLAMRAGIDVNDDQAVLACIADRIRRGLIVACRDNSADAEGPPLVRRLVGGQSVTDLSALADLSDLGNAATAPNSDREPSGLSPNTRPSGDADSIKQPTRVTVHVRDDQQRVLGGLDYRMKLPDGTQRTGVLDGTGAAFVEDISPAGVVELTLLELADAVPGAVVQEPEHDRAATMFASKDDSITLDTGQVHLVTIIIPKRLRRLRSEHLRFANNSPTLVPLEPHNVSPLLAIATALGALRADPDAGLVVVGHASATGPSNRNQQLSELRAQCAQTLLRGDRETWVELVANHGSPEDVQRLLTYLHRAHDWPTDPGLIDGIAGPLTEDAVRGFQATYNAEFEESIEQHGRITKETLGAFFDVQMEELNAHCLSLGIEDPGAEVRSFSDPLFVSCSAELAEHPAFPESADPSAQRRVDLFLVRSNVTWEPSDGAAALVEEATIELIEIKAPVVPARTLVIELVDHYGRALPELAYTVTTSTEERTGTTNDRGLLEEADLTGENPTLSLEGDPIVSFDPLYLSVSRTRHDTIPAPAQGDPDDEDGFDDPLPALLDEEDDDESEFTIEFESDDPDPDEA